MASKPVAPLTTPLAWSYAAAPAIPRPIEPNALPIAGPQPLPPAPISAEGRPPLTSTVSLKEIEENAITATPFAVVYHIPIGNRYMMFVRAYAFISIAWLRLETTLSRIGRFLQCLLNDSQISISLLPCPKRGVARFYTLVSNGIKYE